MKIKFRNMSLQGKISSIYVLANLLVFIVNIILLTEINSMSHELDMVYQENLHLNELAGALSDVQKSMTDYLNVKTSDSLGDFYWGEQIFVQMIQELDDEITDAAAGQMERSIRHISENYLNAAEQAIDAKRGRNVEKYRVWYENATEMYGYINTYIYSLNNRQFERNSENYSRLSATFRLFESVSIVVLVGVIIGNVGIIVRLTRTLIKPLNMLAVSAGEVAEGNFDTEIAQVSSQDEIGVLTRAFGQMVKSLQAYIERVRESVERERELKERELMMEAHLKDAQLKYLQAQINPHFLFNTLNAGAQLAMLEGADRTYEYVQNMAEFFRYNVKKGDDIATLREEIELVDHYIYILNVRFSGDIHYEKRVDDALLDAAMPSMILQPVVENCVNHGIREMAGAGRIWLNVYREDDRVCVSVKDNGVGMSEENIRRVLDGTYRESGMPEGSNGIGMDNVIARLRLFLESDDVMTIRSAGEDQGTEVIIYLRGREQEEEDV